MDNNAASFTNELLAEAKTSILFTAVRPDIIMERGQGMYLWDTLGKKYLDFVGGWAVTSLGHSPEVIATALEKQSRLLVNASPAFYNTSMINFAKLLTNISCFDRVFFASSGAEANESAIKLARKYGALHRNGAFEIITTTNSFHGRTLATMSASGKKKWESLFEPKVPGFIHVPLNDIEALRTVITKKTCAIMLEPVQGEGGVFAADQSYMDFLSQICSEKDIMLIFDEVQTGLGRTGKMFAYEHYGINPDVMTLAKGIGGGFPLSAMLAKEKFNVFEAGDQGGTYSSQPLAMEVGYAVVNEIIEKKLTENAGLQGEYMAMQLQKIMDKFDLRNIRGKGLLMAFDLPAEKGGEIVAQCLQDGLLVNSPQPQTIRLMPPLIVTHADIDAMMEILSSALSKVIK